MVTVSLCNNSYPSSNMIQKISDLLCHLLENLNIGIKVRSIFSIVCAIGLILHSTYNLGMYLQKSDKILIM